MSRDSIRGFAAGLLFSTIIIGSYYYLEENKQQELTIKQLEEASAKLGYKLSNKNEHSKEENVVEEKQDITIEDEVEASTSDPVKFSLTIKNGMGSDDIAQILYENKMIESTEGFEAFFKDRNLTKKIQVGDFQLTKGMPIQDIANIITKN